MSFEQTTFLGSSITGFTASGGFNDTTSQLSVGLVDDPANGDSFIPGNVGRPVQFVFGGFTFCGILQSYSQNINTSGNTREVTVTDPREYLDGVQLILDGYTGDVSSIYNVLNVYGYLESFGFGYSQKNETGIPWKNVRTAIHELTNLSQQGVYGGPLYFVQSRYIVDLSLLPDVPDDFRIGSDSTTLLGFISEVCEAGGCSFSVRMIEASTGIFVIQVNTISRSSVINYGALTQFLGLHPEFETKQIGMELQNETTSKFLVGGKMTDLWYQYYDGSINTVWQFWGLDINGNPIIGEGYGDDHFFVLDSRSVNNPRVGPFYPTNVAEIRAVLAGRASWETFLLFQQGTGVHANKARDLNIIGYISGMNPQTILENFLNDYNSDPPGSLKQDPGKWLFPHLKEDTDLYEQLEIETGYLYDFLYSIATEYYGKKFMVAIPYTYATEEPDTGKIRVSQLPVDSGYLDESAWPDAINSNRLPLEVDRITEEDGRIQAFVRFNNGELLDLSDLDPSSVAFNNRNAQYGARKLANTSVFVKCTVDEGVYYLNKETLYGPRAVITLDGVVRNRVEPDDIPGKELLEKFLKGGFSDAGIDVTTEEFKTGVIDKFLGYVGQDIFNYGNATSATSPDLAVVPLESQVSFYGPWSASGGVGKVEYEQDESLVPWNYGGWTALNLAAESKVVQAISTNYQLEQGEITFPDVPFHNLCEPIISGGPLITDISVTIGSNGAHTTYKFRRNVKQPRYGQAKADRVAQLSRKAQQTRRNMRLIRSPKRRKNLETTKIPVNIITRQDNPKVKKTSSHEMLVGQIYTTSSGNYNSAVFIQPDYNFSSHVRYDYENKAFMTLDGLLVPFSTVQKSGYPSLLTTSSGQIPTVEDLNTFKYGHNIKLVAGGDSIPEDLYNQSRDGMRPLALRGPLYICGPGFTVNGKPIPNLSENGSSDEFSTNYKTDVKNWPVGPVDLRYDEERGVWTGGTGTGLIRGTMISTSQARLSNGGTTVEVINWLGSNIGSGDNVYLTLDSNQYYIVNQTYYSVGPNGIISSFTCNEDGTFNTCNKSFKIPSRVSSSPTGCT
jgi:hypothetical protein